ncbi:circularly permuted type 2 ATP-grasp protein [Vibrio sp. M60_M31a]
MSKLTEGYDSGEYFDELIDSAGKYRDSSCRLLSYIDSLPPEELDKRKLAAEATIQEMGISFTVYTEEGNIDRAWPFDIIPRTIDAKDWETAEKGLKQRLTALNRFIDDLYHDQNCIKDGIIPAHIIKESKNFRPECVGVSPPFGVWAHICGTDLVRADDGQFYVLEDNLRVPSGVSYMLENRAVTKRVLPELFENDNIRKSGLLPFSASGYATSALTKRYPATRNRRFNPGIYNSAYFEHAFLAQQMGAELVEGGDLYVGKDDCVYMKTIYGPERVDVIYRRIDDMFLDPEAFDPDSMLGVPGLMRAWKQGNVALANAPGAGVADDKVVYAYVPQLIKYYLDEEPILPNVETFLCEDKDDREYVLKNLDKLVVKPANESGGYGMLVGPHSSKKEQAVFAELIKNNPRNYIAQPTLKLSTAPTLIEKGKLGAETLGSTPVYSSKQEKPM